MSRKRIVNNLWGWFFAAPSVILICALYLWPVVQNIYYSLCQMKGFSKPVFIGLENYQTIFRDAEVGRAFVNTVVYTVLTVPVGVFFSLIAACLLNTSIRGKGFFRTIYYIPVVSAPVAVAMVWRWMYNYEYGIINHMLNAVGIPAVNWIADGNVVLISLAIIGIWSMVGYNMVILLGGLQNISKIYYEAAEVDGAGPVRRFVSITLPLVTPTLFFVMLTTMISSLQVFDSIYMIVGELNPALNQAQSVVFLFYRYMFKLSNKGYGATIGTLLMAVILVLTFVQMRTQRKWVHYQ